MAKLEGQKANREFEKANWVKNQQVGEKLTANTFKVKVDGFENAEFLVRAFQYPAMGTADVEDFGQGGLGTTQNGPTENVQEFTIQFVETIQGETLLALKQIILGDTQPNVEFWAESKSLGGKVPNSGCRALATKWRTDAADFSTEDPVALVKPAVTIKSGWIEHEGVDY